VSCFVLIPGAGGIAWYWHRVVPLVTAAGHEARAVDLPGDDARAGLDTYADRVVDAIGSRSDVVLVAQSLAGFTAALVSARVAIRRLAFVNAMIPVPGETVGAWWANTGATADPMPMRLLAGRSDPGDRRAGRSVLPPRVPGAGGARPPGHGRRGDTGWAPSRAIEPAPSGRSIAPTPAPPGSVETVSLHLGPINAHVDFMNA
jgi:hypothetical protein